VDSTVVTRSRSAPDSQAVAEAIERGAVGSENANMDQDVDVLARLSTRSRHLRISLRSAQQERDACRAKRDRIGGALERATGLTAMLAARLSDFSALDDAIAEECAASILRLTEFPAESTLELSPELKREAEQKFFFESQLAAATHASERLRQDLAVAERELAAANSVVDGAAVAVAACEVEPIADELARVEDQAAMLRLLLIGYGAQRYADGFLPLSSASARLLRGAPRNAGVDGGLECREAAECWRCYLQELSMNSSATIAAVMTRSSSRGL
jgi:hypothetical protein